MVAHLRRERRPSCGGGGGGGAAGIYIYKYKHKYIYLSICTSITYKGMG